MAKIQRWKARTESCFANDESGRKLCGGGYLSAGRERVSKSVGKEKACLKAKTRRYF